MAMTVEDVLVRRTHLFHTHAQQGVTAAPRVARLLGGEIGWDEEEMERRAQAYRDEASRMREAINPERSA
jgi:glycerol-3-phosphate dehydrogenase